MYLVLPDSGLSPRRLLDSLATTGWPVPDARTARRRVRLRLPRLHVEQATDLKPALRGLGLDILFSESRADLAALLVPSPTPPPPCPPISAGPRPDDCTLVRISDAAQHVFLDVTEEGTEAALVTVLAFEVMVTSAGASPLEFTLDRPFLFAIRDERTGTMLFVGYVDPPRSRRGVRERSDAHTEARSATAPRRSAAAVRSEGRIGLQLRRRSSGGAACSGDASALGASRRSGRARGSAPRPRSSRSASGCPWSRTLPGSPAPWHAWGTRSATEHLRNDFLAL